jgi:hypothetical protein
MPNPRNVVDFEGIDAVFATFLIDNSTIVYDGTKIGGAATTMLDKAVSLSAAGTVQLASDAEAIVGKLVLVEADNKCNVQVEGFMKLPGGASASLTRGLKIIGALGAASAKGYIREVASGTAAEINKGRGQIIDATDATQTVVNLT